MRRMKIRTTPNFGDGRPQKNAPPRTATPSTTNTTRPTTTPTTTNTTTITPSITTSTTNSTNTTPTISTSVTTTVIDTISINTTTKSTTPLTTSVSATSNSPPVNILTGETTPTVTVPLTTTPSTRTLPTPQISIGDGNTKNHAKGDSHDVPLKVSVAIVPPENHVSPPGSPVTNILVPLSSSTTPPVTSSMASSISQSAGMKFTAPQPMCQAKEQSDLHIVESTSNFSKPEDTPSTSLSLASNSSEGLQIKQEKKSAVSSRRRKMKFMPSVSSGLKKDAVLEKPSSSSSGNTTVSVNSVKIASSEVPLKSKLLPSVFKSDSTLAESDQSIKYVENKGANPVIASPTRLEQKSSEPNFADKLPKPHVQQPHTKSDRESIIQIPVSEEVSVEPSQGVSREHGDDNSSVIVLEATEDVSKRRKYSSGKGIDITSSINKSVENLSVNSNGVENTLLNNKDLKNISSNNKGVQIISSSNVIENTSSSMCVETISSVNKGVENTSSSIKGEESTSTAGCKRRSKIRAMPSLMAKRKPVKRKEPVQATDHASEKCSEDSIEQKIPHVDPPVKEIKEPRLKGGIKPEIINWEEASNLVISSDVSLNAEPIKASQSSEIMNTSGTEETQVLGDIPEVVSSDIEDLMAKKLKSEASGKKKVNTKKVGVDVDVESKTLGSKLSLEKLDDSNICSDDSSGDKENSTIVPASHWHSKKDSESKQKTQSQQKRKLKSSFGASPMKPLSKLGKKMKIEFKTDGKEADEDSKSKQIFRERKEEYRKKVSRGGLEPSKMTMFDLIFWNPSNNPMPGRPDTEKKRARNSSRCETESVTSDVLEEQRVDDLGLDKEEPVPNSSPPVPEEPLPSPESQPTKEVESDNDNKPEEEQSEPQNMLAPRVKIGANGQIILDEQSLEIQTTAAKNRDVILSKTEVVEENNDTSFYGKWSKRRKRSCEWTMKETAKFYKALSTVGTDFSMMASLITWRSRAELKTKFKKEERANRELIDRALRDSTQFDMSLFDDESDYDPEEDRKATRQAEREEAKQRRMAMKQEVKEAEEKVKRAQDCKTRASNKSRKKLLRKARTAKSLRKSCDGSEDEAPVKPRPKIRRTKAKNPLQDLRKSCDDSEDEVPCVPRPKIRRNKTKKQKRERRESFVINEVTVTMEYSIPGAPSVELMVKHMVEQTVEENCERTVEENCKERTIEHGVVDEDHIVEQTIKENCKERTIEHGVDDAEDHIAEQTIKERTIEHGVDDAEDRIVEQTIKENCKERTIEHGVDDAEDRTVEQTIKNCKERTIEHGVDDAEDHTVEQTIKENCKERTIEHRVDDAEDRIVEQTIKERCKERTIKHGVDDNDYQYHIVEQTIEENEVEHIDVDECNMEDPLRDNDTPSPLPFDASDVCDMQDTAVDISTVEDQDHVEANLQDIELYQQKNMHETQQNMNSEDPDKKVHEKHINSVRDNVEVDENNLNIKHPDKDICLPNLNIDQDRVNTTLSPRLNRFEEDNESTRRGGLTDSQTRRVRKVTETYDGSVRVSETYDPQHPELPTDFIIEGTVVNDSEDTVLLHEDGEGTVVEEGADTGDEIEGTVPTVEKVKCAVRKYEDVEGIAVDKVEGTVGEGANVQGRVLEEVKRIPYEDVDGMVVEEVEVEGTVYEDMESTAVEEVAMTAGPSTSGTPNPEGSLFPQYITGDVVDEEGGREEETDASHQWPDDHITETVVEDGSHLMWHFPVSAIQLQDDGQQVIVVPTSSGHYSVPVPHLPPGTSNVVVMATPAPDTPDEHIYHVYVVSPMDEEEG